MSLSAAILTLEYTGKHVLWGVDSGLDAESISTLFYFVEGQPEAMSVSPKLVASVVASVVPSSRKGNALKWQSCPEIGNNRP